MLRYVTAGESHGKCLIGILEGLPSGLAVDTDFINDQLHRRQLGYGRGRRMQIERDHIEITSGVRHGKTLGSPVSFTIENKDWNNWRIPMSTDPVPEGSALGSITRPRPGHVDLAGVLKHQTHDVRNVLERASARETAARVAVGAFCRLLLLRFNIRVGSHVLAIGNVRVPARLDSIDLDAILAINPDSQLRCADADVEKAMIALIDKAASDGDTLGGIAEVVASPVPPGLGSHSQWDQKLDGRIAQALMSIPAVKAVEIGNGIAAAQQAGSSVHDEIFYDAEHQRFFRKTNNAGGLEAGVTNSADVCARIFVKPIPTLRKPLMSVDLITKEASSAAFERSDTCVVPAAGVVAEAMIGFVVAQAFLGKFGGDSMTELEANFTNYNRMLSDF
ncbi:MAG: chorismate synthase [Acidobacteriota bacterium]|jgi:chorismate synthase